MQQLHNTQLTFVYMDVALAFLTVVCLTHLQASARQLKPALQVRSMLQLRTPACTPFKTVP